MQPPGNRQKFALINGNWAVGYGESPIRSDIPSKRSLGLLDNKVVWQERSIMLHDHKMKQTAKVGGSWRRICGCVHWWGVAEKVDIWGKMFEEQNTTIQEGSFLSILAVLGHLLEETIF